MQRIESILYNLSRKAGLTAGAAVILMMLLTCTDVVMRFFNRPLPGTYEIVGFLGTFAVALALAATSVEKGHIAVDLLVNRFPQRLQILIDAGGSLFGFVLFAALTWQSSLYALDLRQSGEVSATLGMPVYPFAAGIAFGCALLCLILITDFSRSIRRMLS